MQPTVDELLGALPGAVLLCDPAGRVVQANAAALSLLGAPPPGAAAADLLPGLNWAAVLAGGQVSPHPYTLPRGTGALAYLSPLPAGGAVAWLVPREPGQMAEPVERPAPAPRAGDDPFAVLVGDSPAMAEVRRQAALAAASRATVLVSGESGTGKELLARAIHGASPRHRGPFVAVNCAAVPEGLLEAEFFGYADGAFTGARRGGKAGKFELAHGGTLFLDEIGDLAPGLQAKLLRVLQEREVERVGDTSPRRVDVRVIAASNRPLADMVEAGLFRPDLYFRLNVLSLWLPPLRERPEDVPLLVAHLLERLAPPGVPAPRVTPAAMAALAQYPWPGNVRELENVVERALALEPGGDITPERLRLSVPAPAAAPTPWRRHKEEAELSAVLGALERAGGNKAAAARILGLSRSQLYAKLDRLSGRHSL